jgi:hypothetical protein
MNRQLLAGLAGLLAIAAFAVMPVTAEAVITPHWYSEGKLVGGQPVHVKTAGTLTFDLTQFGVPVTCKVKDTDVIVNPASGGPGTDEMIAFKLSGCKVPAGVANICSTKVEIIARALPWHTHLAEEPPAPGIRDVIEGVQLEVRCKKGKNYGIFMGTLNPKVGNSVLEFEGGAELKGTFGGMAVTGTDKLTGPKGDKKITAA